MPLADFFDHLVADFLHDAGIIDILRYGNSGYSVEDLFIMRGKTRLRLFGNGFRNLIVIDFFRRGNRFDDFFFYRLRNSLVIGFRTGGKFFELLLDFREYFIDLLEEFDFAFHRIQLGEYVFRQNCR